MKMVDSQLLDVAMSSPHRDLKYIICRINWGSFWPWCRHWSFHGSIYVFFSLWYRWSITVIRDNIVMLFVCSIVKGDTIIYFWDKGEIYQNLIYHHRRSKKLRGKKKNLKSNSLFIVQTIVIHNLYIINFIL